MLTIIFKRNYCSRHHFVLNPRATINFEYVFSAKSWFLRIRKMPKMIKKFPLFAKLWQKTWLQNLNFPNFDPKPVHNIVYFSQNRIFKFSLSFYHSFVFSCRSISDSKPGWKCLFLPKIALSISFIYFITLLYFTIFYKIRGLQSIVNVFLFSIVNVFSFDFRSRQWLKNA